MPGWTPKTLGERLAEEQEFARAREAKPMSETPLLLLTKGDRMDAMTLIAMDAWSSEEDALAASYLEGYENLVAQLEAELAQVRVQQEAERESLLRLAQLLEIAPVDVNSQWCWEASIAMHQSEFLQGTRSSMDKSTELLPRTDAGSNPAGCSTSGEALATGTPPAPKGDTGA